MAILSMKRHCALHYVESGSNIMGIYPLGAINSWPKLNAKPFWDVVTCNARWNIS